MFGRKTRWFIPVIPVVLGSMMAVGCHHRPSTPEERADWITDKISDELDLTKDQEVKVKAIVLNVQSQVPDLKKARMDAWSELYSQVQADKVDATRLTDNLNARRDEMSKAIPAISQGFADLYAILTPEQRADLKKSMEKINRRLTD
ncbi:MAG: Spy/CpxP family protein refolding chaperone [Bacteroidetes bacterium]|nr:Spy/CpxP family protein refolding chaperone [Bacteroidota bacterium]